MTEVHGPPNAAAEELLCRGPPARKVKALILLAVDSAASQELGERVRSVTLDVTSEADWTAAVAAAQHDGWGAVTVLVNNAGIMMGE